MEGSDPFDDLPSRGNEERRRDKIHFLHAGNGPYAVLVKLRASLVFRKRPGKLLRFHGTDVHCDKPDIPLLEEIRQGDEPFDPLTTIGHRGDVSYRHEGTATEGLQVRHPPLKIGDLGIIREMDFAASGTRFQ